MAVPRQRILDLMKVYLSIPLRLAPFPSLPHNTQRLTYQQIQCRLFNTIFNPTASRLGNKILRQRLRGPSLAAYYPRRVATFTDLQKLYPGGDMYDETEEDRLEHIQIAKSRGKGAPKKKKSAAESRKKAGGKKR